MVTQDSLLAVVTSPPWVGAYTQSSGRDLVEETLGRDARLVAQGGPGHAPDESSAVPFRATAESGRFPRGKGAAFCLFNPSREEGLLECQADASRRIGGDGHRTAAFAKLRMAPDDLTVSDRHS